MNWLASKKNALVVRAAVRILGVTSHRCWYSRRGIVLAGPEQLAEMTLEAGLFDRLLKKAG